jgi:hypothetical protein
MRTFCFFGCEFLHCIFAMDFTFHCISSEHVDFRRAHPGAFAHLHPLNFSSYKQLEKLFTFAAIWNDSCFTITEELNQMEKLFYDVTYNQKINIFFSMKKLTMPHLLYTIDREHNSTHIYVNQTTGDSTADKGDMRCVK